MPVMILMHGKRKRKELNGRILTFGSAGIILPGNCMGLKVVYFLMARHMGLSFRTTLHSGCYFVACNSVHLIRNNENSFTDFYFLFVVTLVLSTLLISCK